MSAGDELDPIAGTARWTAAERARESARPDGLFNDPLAGLLAGDSGRALAERMRGDGTFDNPAMAIRTRFFDDVLIATLTVRRTAAQVVLVGQEWTPVHTASSCDLVEDWCPRARICCLRPLSRAQVRAMISG